MSTNTIDYNNNVIKGLDDKITASKILLILFVSINICILVSRSVMEAVGNNDGKDCPNVGGPAFACSLYGVSVLILITFIIMNRNNLSGIKIGLFGLLAILNLGIFIAYIPFAVKAQGHDSAIDNECLTNANKDAIEKMELIITGVLIVLTPIMLYMN
jgi:hypothetical protein